MASTVPPPILTGHFDSSRGTRPTSSTSIFSSSEESLSSAPPSTASSDGSAFDSGGHADPRESVTSPAGDITAFGEHDPHYDEFTSVLAEETSNAGAVKHDSDVEMREETGEKEPAADETPRLADLPFLARRVTDDDSRSASGADALGADGVDAGIVATEGVSVAASESIQSVLFADDAENPLQADPSPPSSSELPPEAKTRSTSAAEKRKFQQEPKSNGAGRPPPRLRSPTKTGAATRRSGTAREGDGSTSPTKSREERAKILAELDEEERRVRDGTDPAYLKHLRTATANQTKHRKSNDLRLKLQLKHFRLLVQGEERAGSDWLLARRASTRQDMIEKIQNQIYQLEREWKAELDHDPVEATYAQFDDLTPKLGPREISDRDRRRALSQVMSTHGLHAKPRRGSAAAHAAAAAATATGVSNRADSRGHLHPHSALSATRTATKPATDRRPLLLPHYNPSAMSSGGETDYGFSIGGGGGSSSSAGELSGSSTGRLRKRKMETSDEDLLLTKKKRFKKFNLGGLRVAPCSAFEAEEDLALMGCK